MQRTTRSLVVAGLFILALQTVGAQTLTVTQWNTSTAQGGANIQAEYAGIPPTWCPSANVRWLQRILLKEGDGTTQKNDVPGYPSGNFIDPQPNQPGAPLWDQLPWYDVTYNTAAQRAANGPIQHGSGAFMNDSPSGWGPFGPMYFCATTAVVCIDTDMKMATLLGGFEWGFCVAANGAITPTPATPTGIAAATLRNAGAGGTAAMFNTALAAGAFGAGTGAGQGWSIKPSVENCELTFRYAPVPEPATMALCGAALVAAARRRRKAS